jgi:transcriptional regulator with XRE-family HTH domain
MTDLQNDGFGLMIRKIRQAQKPPLALRELARRCGISAAYLSNIERDLCAAPSVDVVKALARELNADPAEFLRKANRQDPEFFSEAMDPSIVSFLRLIDAMLPSGPTTLLNMKNLLAYMFTEFENEDFPSSELELFALFFTAYSKLKLEEQNPSAELTERLTKGTGILRLAMPDLFKGGTQEEILNEFMAMGKQKQITGNNGSESV